MSSNADPVRTPAMRLRQGLVLLLGAVVFAAVVGPEPDRFYLTPLGLGLVYLGAAAAGGRRGGYWATAIVLVAWGAAVVWISEGRPDLDTAGVYLTAVGLGAAAGLLLARRGFAVDALGLAATIVLAGLSLAFATQSAALVEAGRTPSPSASSGSSPRSPARCPCAQPATERH